LLLENIQQRLLENAGQCLREGQPEVAISLYKTAESLNPKVSEKSYWYHFSLAESYLKRGMGDEAAKAYGRALQLTVLPREKTYILQKLMEIRNLPFGYFIWRSDGVWHLRWWSDEKRAFSGKIVCSAKIKEVLQSHLTSEDQVRHSKTRLEFNGLTLGKRIEGFDVVIKNDARLSFYLRIDSRRNIADKVILLPDLVHPEEMPFSLGQ
jgi:tetratricopeptide (TPR) repeat protein